MYTRRSWQYQLQVISASGDISSRYALPRFLSRKNTLRTLVHLHEALRNVNGGRDSCQIEIANGINRKRGTWRFPFATFRFSRGGVSFAPTALCIACTVKPALFSSFSMRCKPGGVTLLSVYCNLAHRFYNQSVAMDRTVVTRSSDHGHKGSPRKAAQRIAFHDG